MDTPRKDVLVVDDDPGILRAVARLLGPRFTVRTAGDPYTALRLASSRRPDLVLLDVHLAVGSGLEALRELTRFDPDLRVVMLSGDADPDTVDRAMSAGAVAYVTKPLMPDEVADIVDHAIPLPHRA